MTGTAPFALPDGTVVRPCVPFFIAGSGRCGTTLLRRLLIERAGVVIPPENYLLAVSPRLLQMAQGNWAAFCRLVLANMVKHSGRWDDFGLDAAAALALLAGMPDSRRCVADFWHAFHALYAGHVGRPSETRWGDKTPSSVDALPELAGIFPQARFVFMVRDVFDMAWSFGSMAASGRSGDYLGGARRWVDANRKLLAFATRHAALALILRYEDLVQQPERQLERVLTHIDGGRADAADARALHAAEAKELAAQPALRNALHAVHTDSIGQGRVHLAEDVKAAIAAMAAPLQSTFGYAPCG